MVDRLLRQSFLGSDSDATLWRLRVAIVGLGGGGSHIAQQLAHVGVGKFVLIDPDVVEDSNLNRLVGAGARDAIKHTPKVQVLKRVILDNRTENDCRGYASSLAGQGRISPRLRRSVWVRRQLRGT